jgi:hypothetical protein
MFALDLFNTDHERRIAEGAVDQLEQRRIDDLAMKMDDLVARAKKAPTAEVKAALMKEFQKCKAERDGYFKIKAEGMGYGGLGETEQQKGPRPEDIPAYLRKQQGRAPLTPQQVKAPTPGTISHPDVLRKNRGNPDEIEEGFGPIGSKALMNGNLATFMKARQTRTPVTLDIGGEQFRLTPVMMDAMAKKYNDDKAAADSNPTDKDVKLIAINNYRAFGHPDLMKKFIANVATPEPTPTSGEPGEQLPMFEKTQQFQKKKSNNEPALNSSSVRDTKLSRELTKARGAYPTAGSDVEALVRQELDTGERIKQDVDAVQTTNTAQDQTLAQLQKVNQQQTAQIAGLEKQLSTVAQQAQQPARVAPVPQTTPTAQTPATAKPADIPIATDIPEPTTPRDQEIYNKVQSLEKELKDKIDAMASWNAIAQKDPQSNNELVDLRKEVDRTRKELQRQINKLTKTNKEPTMVKSAPKPKALPDPNVVDVDAWEIPDMGTAQELEPIAAREGTEKPTALGQMAKNVGQGQELQRDPAYRNQVRRTQQQTAQRQQNIAQQKAGYGDDADEFGDIPNINEGEMKELDIMRQDVERMSDRQFYTAYGISKAAFQQKYRTLLKPTLDEHGGGIGPKQHWQDLMQERKLTVGDPIVITGPNEFEGKTGEIYEFSPSGKFVIVDLYNHGKHSMHLSDIEYNQYADQEQDEEDDWYDKGLDESVNPQFINAQVTKLLAGEARRMTNAPMAQLLAPVMKQYNLTLQQIDGMVPGGLKRAAGEYGIMMKEGWSDAMVARRTGRPRTPYSVYINGKKWKDFENDDHAEAVANKLRAKFKADGRDPGVITIAPTDYDNNIKEAEGRVDPILIKALNRMPDGLATHREVLDAAYDAYAMELGKMAMRSEYGVTNAYIPQLMSLYKDKHGLTFNEDLATPPPEAPRPAIIAPAPAEKYMVKKPQAPRAQADEPAPRHAKGSIYSDDETTLKVYKPEQYREAKADSTGSWVVYNGNKVMKFKTHGGAKTYAEKNGGKVASSEFYADKIQKQGVAETALNPQDPQGDYAAKRKALHDLSLNKDVDQAAVQQRRLDLDREAEAKGVKEGRLEDLPGIDYVRPGEIKRKASGGDHNPYPYSKEEDDDYFREIFRKKREAAAKTKAQGGSLNELSTEKLAQYKKAAGADASTADKRGDIERGNKRFKGIVKATIKQGNNDAKKHPSVAEGHADQQRKIFKKNGNSVGEVGIDRESSPGNGQYYMKHYASGKDLAGYDSYEEALAELKHCMKQGVTEAAMSNLHADLADVYNRMAPGIERNRDSFKAGQLYDALEAVAEQHGAEAEFKRMMTGARNRAHMDYDTNPGGFQNWFWYLPFGDEVNEGLLKEPTNRKEYLDQRDKLFRMMSMETNPANKQIIKQAINDLEARYGNLKNTVKEEYSTDSEAVERAILNRIMVAHTDLLMKFGPEKVMQAAEEVAYNVGDVDEIGTSDVSAYVNQVKQILGVPEEVNEKWSQKYKSSINCANPKGFSQKAHCAGRKK